MTTRTRLPTLEWALRAGAAELEDLSWVDTAVVELERPFQEVDGDDADGPTKFRHVAYGGFLPPPMREAAAEAAADGRPTTLMAMLLMFARVEWTVAAREHLWTSASPVPNLLAALVEAYGIGPEIHRDDPVRLASLLAHVPRWYPERGNAQRALELLETALDHRPDVAFEAPAKAPESFACHDAAWWADRGGEHGVLSITDGAARIAPASRPEVLPEDVEVVPPAQDEPLPHALLRLLPAWSSLRPTPPRAS